MDRQSRPTLVAIALVVLAVLSLGGAVQADSSKDVTVTNTPANPVPTTIQGLRGQSRTGGPLNQASDLPGEEVRERAP